MTIGITNVGADLAAVVLRLSEKLCAFTRPFLIHLLDISDADVEERTRAVGIGWRGKRDRGFVVSGTASNVQDNHVWATFMITGSRSSTT
jgi:hypothetical protein